MRTPCSAGGATYRYHYCCDATTDAASHEGYTDDEGEYELEDVNKLDDKEVQQPPPGHPPPRSVRDDDRVAKLKLNIPPVEGRYNPDA
jgi:hypothetical protein